MRDAIQTYRGEMACESCYRNAKGTSNVCPIDHEPIVDGEYFNDMHARREILQLPCYCPNKKNGCPWQGVINDLKDHPNVCMYKELSCTKCHDLILTKDIQSHEKDFCRFRSINCRYCGGQFNAQTLQDHEPACHLKPMECPYRCNETISFETLYVHVQRCPRIVSGTICPYQVVGCQHEPRDHEDLMNHLQVSNPTHAAFSVSLVLSLKQGHDRLKEDLMSEQALRVELAKKVEEQSNEKVILATEVEKIQQQLYETQNELKTLQEKCQVGVEQVKEDLREIEERTQQDSVKQLAQKMNEITMRYNEMEGKLRSGGAGPSTAVIGSLNPADVEQGITKLDQLESGSAVLSANLSDLELKLQLLENTTYGGKQLWKVDNVSYRMTQAVTGKVTALHSAPCFQKRGGYKFCSRLYFNGDGMGRGTHVSLFFVVMKSEFDALLQWPFSERVTFRLINPNNREETLEESFLPDKNSSSFKRPTKDMNVAAGCPMFIRKERLQEFIVDDVIYIETSIVNASP